jgi:hypothetical protein
MRQLTEFQDKLIKICSGESTFSKEEQVFFDEHFGQPLTENQIYDMNLRFHLHLKEDEKGDGFKVTKQNKRNTSKDSLPKSLMPLLEPLSNDKADLKKKWSLFSKFLWWSKFVRHIEVDENMWDIGEKLLALYPNGRKAIMIDVRESIKHRTIIEN